MTRTILDFNAEYSYNLWRCEMEKGKGKSSKRSVVKTVLFYLILVGLVLSAYIVVNSRESGKILGPYALSSVLTYSMDSVYPKGSLVVSKALEPEEPLAAGLDIGEDIVFTRSDGESVVHRIIGIEQDEEEAGKRYFFTQGVDNPEPDRESVHEDNVIGKVVWHMPGAGDVLLFISDNLLWIASGVVGFFILIALLKYLFKPSASRKTKRAA